MIYLIVVIIIALYFYLFFKNIGENTQISYRNNKLIMIILFFFIIIIGYFFNNSGVMNHKEYSSILNQHYEIRKNISTIKKIYLYCLPSFRMSLNIIRVG
jgi:Tfp pilus assembly protein PilO